MSVRLSSSASQRNEYKVSEIYRHPAFKATPGTFLWSNDFAILKLVRDVEAYSIFPLDVQEVPEPSRLRSGELQYNGIA